MNLRDAKAQGEREHPELTGTAKIEAIKALRDQDKPAKATNDDQAAPAAKDNAPEPISVGEAWAGLTLVFIGMRLIAWPIWGSPTAGPGWYDVLYVVLLITAITAVASAYRRR